MSEDVVLGDAKNEASRGDNRQGGRAVLDDDRLGKAVVAMGDRVNHHLAHGRCRDRLEVLLHSAL